MAITQEELGRRLHSARKDAGLTQDQVADRIGLARTAVTQIEVGKRTVSSLELDSLAHLLGLDIRAVLADDLNHSSSLAALFRAEPQLVDAEDVAESLRRCLRISREIANLEVLTGVPVAWTGPSNQAPAPADKYRAAELARSLADQERRRLGLGVRPVQNLVEILEEIGVRVSFLDLPEGVSGITMPEADVGPIIVVNAREVATRRLFSLAHEFGHVLMHRAKGNLVSRGADKNHLVEMQANAFAASLLVPSEGVFAFLEAVGKRNQEAGVESPGDDGIEFLAARNREVAAPIRLQDIVKLANHFGVSRSMMTYRLLSLRVISKPESEALRREDGSGRGKLLEQMFGLEKSEHVGAPERYVSKVLSLALEAYDQEKITRGKLNELVSDVLDEVETEKFMRDAAPEHGNDLLLPSL